MQLHIIIAPKAQGFRPEGEIPRRQFSSSRVKESTYSWNIQSVCLKKSRFFMKGRKESVGNDDVSVVRTRK